MTKTNRPLKCLRQAMVRAKQWIAMESSKHVEKNNSELALIENFVTLVALSKSINN